jgi:hypothetical protein
MEVLKIVFAGIVATSAMSAFTEIGFRILRRPYHVIRILGNMMLFRKETPLTKKPSLPILLSSNLLHYAIGVFFPSAII